MLFSLSQWAAQRKRHVLVRPYLICLIVRIWSEKKELKEKNHSYCLQLLDISFCNCSTEFSKVQISIMTELFYKKFTVVTHVFCWKAYHVFACCGKMWGTVKSCHQRCICNIISTKQILISFFKFHHCQIAVKRCSYLFFKKMRQSALGDMNQCKNFINCIRIDFFLLFNKVQDLYHSFITDFGSIKIQFQYRKHFVISFIVCFPVGFEVFYIKNLSERFN